MARRGRKARENKDNLFSGGTFIFPASPDGNKPAAKQRRAPSQAGGRRRGGGRRGKGGSQQMTYAGVTGNLPIQVSISVAEGLFALGSVGIDVYTAGTASKADDLAFPVVEYIGATVGRGLAQRFLSRKHPGLAATIAHGFSAANGDRMGTLIRGKLQSFLKPAGQ